MKFIVSFFSLCTAISLWLWVISPVVAISDVVSTDINEVVKRVDPISKTLGDTAAWVEWWLEWVNELIFTLLIEILFPLITLVAIIAAVLGFWQMILSEDESAHSSWMNFLLYGCLGIVVFQSAWFITTQLVGNDGNAGIFSMGEAFENPFVFARELNDAILPFVALWAYLVTWVLFISLLLVALRMLLSKSEEVTKQSTTILIWNSIGIIIILWARYIVDIVYKKDAAGVDQVIEVTPTTLSFVYKLLNIGMSLIFFGMVVIIIYVAYLLLMNPWDEDKYSVIRRAIRYMFIGLLWLWFSYLIANFFILGRM